MRSRQPRDTAPSPPNHAPRTHGYLVLLSGVRGRDRASAIVRGHERPRALRRIFQRGFQRLF